MERLVRAIVIAAASLATAWWLLHAPERERLSTSMPAEGAGRALDARAQDSPANVAVVGAQSGAEAVVYVRPATPAAGDVDAAGAGNTSEPIPMIEGITLPGGLWNLHTQMEREPRDAAWADDMERQFSTYFASKPELGRNFGQPSVLCRKSSCEIQAVGYGPQAFNTWATATEDLRDQPWGRELRAGGIYTVERAPNEHAVVLILMRPHRRIRSEVPPAR